MLKKVFVLGQRVLINFALATRAKKIAAQTTIQKNGEPSQSEILYEYRKLGGIYYKKNERARKTQKEKGKA